MLYYHKCLDCLTPFASSERKVDVCDCDGPVIFMGIVRGEKWEKVGARPACDGRCTHAHGPSCDCACGGANHGTGRVVNVVVAEGKVKVTDPSEDVYNDMVRGYKYREIRDYADALYTKLFDSADRWDRDARLARMELDKVKSLKLYDRRQQELINWVSKHYRSE